ncbi:hypothetical protein SUGI_0381900 [Cryptomeria japonica]|nr:hypothetical protein SUGI_0381900 [Cryptomeria japonica]
MAGPLNTNKGGPEISDINDLSSLSQMLEGSESVASEEEESYSSEHDIAMSLPSWKNSVRRYLVEIFGVQAIKATTLQETGEILLQYPRCPTPKNDRFMDMIKKNVGERGLFSGGGVGDCSFIRNILEFENTHEAHASLEIPMWVKKGLERETGGQIVVHRMEVSDPQPTREENIDTFIKTLAKFVGSKEADKISYALSTTTYGISSSKIRGNHRKNERLAWSANCNDLITLITPHVHLEFDVDRGFVKQIESSPLVAEHFSAVGENCMRMTALSLLNIINKLLRLQKDGAMLKKAIQAYQQALDVMSFVDNSDPQNPTMDVLKVIDSEVDRGSVAVCNEFQRLLRLHKEKIISLEKLPELAAPEVTPERAFEAINEVLKDAEEQLKAQKLTIIKEEQTVRGEEQNVWEEYYDSRDWTATVACYSKCRVCKLILSRHFNNENELMEYLYESLADVIVSCLLKLPHVLLKRCRDWAVQFEEEKI